MYSTLKAEMARKGMTVRSLSRESGIPQATLYDKFHGRSDLTITQAISIREVLGIDMDMQELFAKD